MSAYMCGICKKTFSGRMPLCRQCYDVWNANSDKTLEIQPDTYVMLKLSLNGIHRQSVLGRTWPIERWNKLKEMRLIRQRPSGYCYTTWFGQQVLERSVAIPVQ